MGWGRTLLLGDIGNRLDIEDTERDIAGLKEDLLDAWRQNRTRDERLEALAAENAEMKLYLASIVRLLLAKGAISRAELANMVEAVDVEDGCADGGFTGSIV